MGYALFPKEINVPPRAWVERSTAARLIHWTEMPRGGHFAALEQPQLLADDMRAFFRKVRTREVSHPTLLLQEDRLSLARGEGDQARDDLRANVLQVVPHVGGNAHRVAGP